MSDAMMEKSIMISVRDAAAWFSVNPATVRLMIEEGTLQAQQPAGKNGSYYIDLMYLRRKYVTEEPLLTAKQVAEIYGVSQKTVRNWVAGNRLRGVQLRSARTLRFRVEDVGRG